MRGVESTTVLHELDASGVLTLTLNRPERHNAWTRELEDALFDLLEQAGESPKVRAVVVTGAGRAFCPGLDSGELDRGSQPGQAYDNRDRRKLTLPALVAKPVVCAINGACAGLGLVLALVSDVRFAVAEPRSSSRWLARSTVPRSTIARAPSRRDRPPRWPRPRPRGLPLSGACATGPRRRPRHRPGSAR
jgi:Enoyl-CoA hydratase/isomerase